MPLELLMLPDERELLLSDTGQLSLSTHRLRLRVTHWGSDYFISLMLENIASCQAVYRSFPILLVLGVLGFLGGLLVGKSEPRIMLLVAGTVLFILYFFTKKMVFRFGSAGDTMTVGADGMSMAAAVEFIDAVEQARFDYTTSHPKK
jgi:hypothetical protein